MSFCHSVHSEPFRPHILSILLCLYRPPMKLRESNAFNYVCLSTRGRCHVTITHNAWDLPVGPPQPHPMDMGAHCTETVPLRKYNPTVHPPWHLVANTGNLFKLVCSRDPHCTAPLQQYWQAGGVHPAGMLSCSNRFSRRISIVSSSLISRAASKYYNVWMLDCLYFCRPTHGWRLYWWLNVFWR